MKRIALISLLVASLVSGCGFHLRGKITLPDSIRTVAITSPDVKLRDALVDSLEANNVIIVNDATADSAHIKIETADFGREVRTIDERGKSTGYVLILRLSYKVFDSAGKELVKPSTAAARRDYDFDDQQLLSATREEELLRDEMREDVAQSILRKMSRIR
jgi:LPS-assembly lipoprotein